LDAWVRVRSVQAVHFSDQRIEADRAQSITKGSPARFDPAAATHVQQEQRTITPQALLEYASRQRSPTLTHT
jgi:outer membrane scaffolding protein for murein synthesis (MipA/OmpV family)